MVKKSNGNWKFNIEDDVYFVDYMNEKPQKKKVLEYKRRTRPNYRWKAKNLTNAKGFRLFFQKK